MTELSALTTRYSPTRLSIYQRILTGEDWTVAGLASSMREATSKESVRDTLYLLLAERIVVAVPRHRPLTFRLTGSGAARLRDVIDVWRSSGDGGAG